MAIHINGVLHILIHESYLLQATQFHRMLFLTKNKYNKNEKWNYLGKIVRLKASHVLCDCEASDTLRYRHLGCQFMKPDDFEDISVSKILQFVQSVVLLNEWAQRLHKRLITVKVCRSIGAHLSVFYSNIYPCLFPNIAIPHKLCILVSAVFCLQSSQHA